MIKTNNILQPESNQYISDGYTVFESNICLAVNDDSNRYFDVDAAEKAVIEGLTENEPESIDWDVVQCSGTRTDYSYAFVNQNITMIRPTYGLICDKVIYMFMNCGELLSLGGMNITITNSNPTLMSMFIGCNKLKYAPFITFPNANVVKIYTSMFANCINLKRAFVWLGDGTQNPVTTRNMMQNTFLHCTSLTDIKFTGVGSPMYLNLSDCPLSNASLVSLKNALMDVSNATAGTYSITLGEGNISKLSDDDKTYYSSIGWTII